MAAGSFVIANRLLPEGRGAQMAALASRLRAVAIANYSDRGSDDHGDSSSEECTP